MMKKMTEAKMEKSKKDMASDKKWVESTKKKIGYNFGGMVKGGKGKKGC